MDSNLTQDHLFISYASEDYSLAEWLTLKLTTEGYKVWCDQIKLLGGESYPKDIDIAIKEQAFRVISLTSKFSLHKANPLKERTLALNIARKREIEFLIPLNVDGTDPSELDWMTSDLTFIPFNENWAEGFSKLLKKLTSINTPKFDNGGSKVCDWFAARDGALRKQELLWTNRLPIIEAPSAISQYRCEMKNIRESSLDWCFLKQNSDTFWSFTAPPRVEGLNYKRLVTLAWNSYEVYDGMNVFYLFKQLCNKVIRRYCVRNGLAVHERDVFFPKGLLKDDKLVYVNSKAKRTYIKIVGERTFMSMGQKEVNRYHLMPVLQFILDESGSPAVQINARLFITDLKGNPIDSTKMNSRRKRLCKNWWNHEWFSRIYAIAYWLRNQDCKTTLLKSENGNFVLGDNLRRFESEFGIDETIQNATGVSHEDEDESEPINEDEITKFERISDDFTV